MAGSIHYYTFFLSPCFILQDVIKDLCRLVLGYTRKSYSAMQSFEFQKPLPCICWWVSTEFLQEQAAISSPSTIERMVSILGPRRLSRSFLLDWQWQARPGKGSSTSNRMDTCICRVWFSGHIPKNVSNTLKKNSKRRACWFALIKKTSNALDVQLVKFLCSADDISMEDGPLICISLWREDCKWHT